MTFQPSNRNITNLIPMWDADGITQHKWFANHMDSNGTIFEWGCKESDLIVTTDGRCGGKFVVYTRNGMYLKHPKRDNESKGRTRYFRSAALAATFAEEAS